VMPLSEAFQPPPDVDARDKPGHEYDRVTVLSGR